ncbi:unnamed protein product [Coregonus sp. 'balchen']|nr:unnamed protein product [Coregonus sp. 'balchen']
MVRLCLLGDAVLHHFGRAESVCSSTPQQVQDFRQGYFLVNRHCQAGRLGLDDARAVGHITIRVIIVCVIRVGGSCGQYVSVIRFNNHAPFRVRGWVWYLARMCSRADSKDAIRLSSDLISFCISVRRDLCPGEDERWRLLGDLSTAKRKFAESLNEFKFQCIGDAETDDEICIAKSLQEFAGVLQNLEDERTRMIENADDVLIMPLERFRKEQISAAKEAKKKYDKETEKYCAVLEKHLSLSAKKKEAHLHEADSQVDHVRQHFYEVSLEYVFKVQEVQERKMFDFLLAFLQGLFTYYHHGYELAKDFNHFKTDLTISIQNTRNRFESTRSEVECLMRKMKENPHEHKSISHDTMEGYLFVQEKRSFVSTWVKYYCTYHREPKRGEEESFTLKSCTRRKTDSIEKRFCFDVEAVDRSGVITMQALSEEDRRLWMEAMDGREPFTDRCLWLVVVVDGSNAKLCNRVAQLDVVGFNVVKKFIYAVETRGIDEQGLYRIVGVNSRVQKLLGLAMGKTER